ncbi:MAG: chemotaxis-specific protein-glutamate methyltransferase CheB [Treponema sp.]
MKKIQVFIVDDSAAVRGILSRELSATREIEVIGTSGDPYAVLKNRAFDVLLLDIEMSQTDGLAFLEYLMKFAPVPVIVMSSLVTPDSYAAVRALELGAVDAAHKPGGPLSVEDNIVELCRKIREAAAVQVWKLCSILNRLNKSVMNIRAVRNIHPSVSAADRALVVVGTSTGGVPVLESLLTRFTYGFPPVLVVICMPEHFTASFAKRLDQLCEFTVKEAQNGTVILPRTIYIAPGGFGMEVDTTGTDRIIRITGRQKVSRRRRPVDILFRSAAKTQGKNCTAILLTGSGCDGALGMKAVRNAGGWTIAQNEESSIVYDMPGKAVALGAACEVIPLNEIAEHIGIRNRQDVNF